MVAELDSTHCTIYFHLWQSFYLKFFLLLLSFERFIWAAFSVSTCLLSGSLQLTLFNNIIKMVSISRKSFWIWSRLSVICFFILIQIVSKMSNWFIAYYDNFFLLSFLFVSCIGVQYRWKSWQSSIDVIDNAKQL